MRVIFCLFSVALLVATVLGYDIPTWLTILSGLPLLGACTNPFDVLRSRVEDLGPTLYVRASWKDPWMNIIPRDKYPVGAGFVRSAFTIGRSEPTTDEETWQEIQEFDTEANTQGPCQVTYNQTYVGYKENQYKPEMFGLVGPLECQDTFTMYWDSDDFWEKYFQALEKRNMKSIVNRLANIYMNYVPKAVTRADGTFEYVDGDIATQPPGSTVDLSDVVAASGLPQCELDQEGHLDPTAAILQEEGADDPNTNGWIVQGPNGPVFPLLIGQEASHRILKNNAELRDDIRFAWEAFGEANPLLKRIGASMIIKNFRHVITRFPPRWRDVGGVLVRVPTWLMSTNAADASKGRVAIINPDWRDPSIARVEGAIVLNPWVYTEEILMPVNSMPGMNLRPQNYLGDWTFITGNDAVLGFDDCTGIKDPTHKYGRHFAEYRHAAKPIFPQYGRLILFTRCANLATCTSCET